MKPFVSVVIPSYNHEKFIQECIQSVLNQTYQDFEIIITDDGSSDRTVDLIEGFSDTRIKLFKFPVNMGASIAANHCILNSSGKYIAMLNSDDIWYPRKLEIQVDYLETHPDISIVFTRAEWIDDAGRPLRQWGGRKNIFNVGNRTRFEWLRHFFYTGNSLCHPCSLIRREHYFDVGLLDPSFASLPDFDLWVRFCLKYDIHVLDQPLVYFRKINEHKNASGDNINNRIRNRFEYKQILDHYLGIREPQELLLIFPEAARYGDVSPDVIPYFLSRMAVETGIDFKMLWGLEHLYIQMRDESISKKLEDRYGFAYRDFTRLAGECDVYKLSLIPMGADFLLRSGDKPNQSLTQWQVLKRYYRDIASLVRSFFFISREFVKNIFGM